MRSLLTTRRSRVLALAAVPGLVLSTHGDVHAALAASAPSAARPSGCVLASPSGAQALGSCTPDWLVSFECGLAPENGVRALRVFDDGSGPELYVAGLFQIVGGFPTSRIASWDGSAWSPLGSGMDFDVVCLSTFDDGTGLALYAGGGFTTAGGVPAMRIARWDGTQWSALGSGLNGLVFDMASSDDGSGPALYVVGTFTTAGGMPASRIAKWDGTSWSAVGTGLNGEGYAVEVLDLGGGPALYVGGDFGIAGGTSAARVARFDGSAWSALGSGIGGVPSYVTSLARFDDGSGPALYVGGDFTTAGGQPARRVAKWNGSAWSALDTGMNAVVDALVAFDDGTGPALFVSGAFTTAGSAAARSIAKWDGATWSALGAGTNNRVFAMSVYDDGSGAALYAGGIFTAAGAQRVRHLARWGCDPAHTGTPYCFGCADCPCGNDSAAGAREGCVAAAGHGAALSGSGMASISADGLVLEVSHLPVPAAGLGQALFVQGSSRASATFLDGRACTAGSQIRLGVKTHAGGTIAYPGPGDPPVSVRGLITTPGVRHYQVVYRSHFGACGTGGNTSNGWSVTWGA